MIKKIDIKNIINKMTLEEKASLCSGYDFWLTKAVKRLNIPQIRMSDGPHGLRKERNDIADELALKTSYPATALPPACNMASTWDTEMVKKAAKVLAEQCKDQKISVILGPGVNIKRSPLCGRNFEYFSEDPFLSGKLATSYIKNIQCEGIGCSLKHFAVNSQEYLRMTINEAVDIRALYELYLSQFEIAVKESQPWTVMASYNKINNTYACDNKYLLNDILREKWGYTGLVVSDWNATNDRVAGIKAGMDIEMPASLGINDKKIVKAVNKGELKIEELDKVVEHILTLINRCPDFDVKSPYITGQNDKLYNDSHEIAREIARESFVLMKNVNSSLPLSKTNKVCVIGAFADDMRYQGTGSSKINPFKLTNFLQAMDQQSIKYDYAPGYSIENENIDNALLEESIQKAQNYNDVLLFIGLTNSFECEGYDRSSLDIPANQLELIKKLYESGKKINVVLFGGSPIDTKWSNMVSSLLNVYLPGEAGGEAICDVIFGDYSPCGHLAETYPLDLNDNPANIYYKMGPKNVEHRESIFIGYRYYDSANKEVAYPFGHGLTYTTFEYSDIQLGHEKMKDTNQLLVSATIKNIGKIKAKEVVQLYVKDNESTIFKADKELKGFTKIELNPGESKQVIFRLDKRSFAYYAKDIDDWYVESGEYTIMLGSSSRDIRLSKSLHIESTSNYVEKINKNDFPTYYDLTQSTEIPKDEFERLCGFELPTNEVEKRGKMNLNNTIGDLQCCIIGKIIKNVAPSIIKKNVPNADITTLMMIEQGMMGLPLRGLSSITSGIVHPRFVEGILTWANKKRLKSLFIMSSGLFKTIGNLIKAKQQARQASKEIKALVKAHKKD